MRLKDVFVSDVNYDILGQRNEGVIKWQMDC